MRTAFMRTLIECARVNHNIWLIIGDLGYSVVEGFKEEFPDRFINAGIAEQNMTGVAAGLALSGKIVFTYSIANFPTLRCLEQIRNDVCYHNLNVKIVAVGGGLTYGAQGITHHATEDLAIMRALPNMTVVAPGDPVEARLATRAIISYPGPCYLRLGKANEPIVHREQPDFQIGTAIRMRTGQDAVLISTGGMLFNTILAADLLAAKGIESEVLSLPTLKPLDNKAILDAAAQTKRMITIEEHRLTGGLGSAVAEVLAESNARVAFKRIGISDEISHELGSQEYLRGKYGLSPQSICETIVHMIGHG